MTIRPTYSAVVRLSRKLTKKIYKHYSRSQTAFPDEDSRTHIRYAMERCHLSGPNLQDAVSNGNLLEFCKFVVLNSMISMYGGFGINLAYSAPALAEVRKVLENLLPRDQFKAESDELLKKHMDDLGKSIREDSSTDFGINPPDDWDIF